MTALTTALTQAADRIVELKETLFDRPLKGKAFGVDTAEVAGTEPDLWPYSERGRAKG